MNKSISSLTEKCTVKSILAKGPDGSELDCYGMFAMKTILPREIILRESTVVCAARLGAERCSACCGFLPKTSRLSKCCKTAYCNANCAVTAVRYHASVCRKDFFFIIHETFKPESFLVCPRTGLFFRSVFKYSD